MRRCKREISEQFHSMSLSQPLFNHPVIRWRAGNQIPFPDPKGCEFDFPYSLCKISSRLPLGAGVKAAENFIKPDFLLLQ